MGNSRWRLETTLNYVADRVHELVREEEVEILVADWGSDIPLRDVLKLSTAAARMVSFILVPPELARILQKDSPFPEVLALNAAARRVNGEYIGRIDQDTLVGIRFLKYFFELYEDRQRLEIPLASALLFANQRMVPFRFTVRTPPLWVMEKYINSFGDNLTIEVTSGSAYYKHGVGIWLAHRDLWETCGGYDERMIYMNAMEVDMIGRLTTKYELVNLGQLVNYDFYHLEHYHPLKLRSSSTHRKVNPELHNTGEITLNPNGLNWGLVQHPLEILPHLRDHKMVEIKTQEVLPLKWLSFWFLAVSTGTQIVMDEVVKPIKAAYVVWRRRAHIAWETIHREPFLMWPRLLANLWKEKSSQRQKRIRNHF